MVTLGEDGVTEDDLLVHDEQDRGLAFLLAEMSYPDFPEAVGVIYRGPGREPYERLVWDQEREAVEKRGKGDLDALLHEGDTWVVE